MATIIMMLPSPEAPDFTALSDIRHTGKPAMNSAVVIPAASVPTKKAPTKASTPMFTGQMVATTNITHSA